MIQLCPNSRRRQVASLTPHRAIARACYRGSVRSLVVVIAMSSVAGAETPKPVPPPALTKPDRVPEVRGPTGKIEERKAISIGGVSVRFAYASHKHPAGSGPAPGMWGFVVTKNGRTQELELRHVDAGFESEIAAHGVLLVFRHRDYSTFEIVAAGKAGTPLDDDGCDAAIDKAAAKRGFPPATSASTGEANGVFEKQTPSWRGFCGSYTRRVWFAPPATP